MHSIVFPLSCAELHILFNNNYYPTFVQLWLNTVSFILFPFFVDRIVHIVSFNFVPTEPASSCGCACTFFGCFSRSPWRVGRLFRGRLFQNCHGTAWRAGASRVGPSCFSLGWGKCPYALARRNLANLAPTICLRKVRTFALVCVRVRKFVEVYMKWHEFAYVLLAQPSSFRMMSQQLIILDDRQKFSLECSSIYWLCCFEIHVFSSTDEGDSLSDVWTPPPGKHREPVAIYGFWTVWKKRKLKVHSFF